MRITPFAVLEQHAREEYRRRFSGAPEPRYLNARALLQLDAPRSLVWGGVGYWAPPLGFEDGARLFALSGFLADALRQDHASATRDAVALTVPLLHKALRRRRLPWWRIIARIQQADAAERAFLNDDPHDLLALVRWLLYVEDEAPTVPPSTRVTIDLLDNRYAFEGFFKRPPRSWKDYVYGMHHLGRQASRKDLRLAVATRIGVNGDKDGWRDYERELRAAAGW
jgi:hypothetical protein